MPTRPRIAGRERRVYALICTLPFSGASTAHFSFDMTIESFLEGHVRAFAWLGGVPRECVYDNLRSAVAKREARRRRGHPLEPAVLAAARALRVSRARLHAGDAAREGLGRGRGPLSQDRVLAGAALRGRWPSSTTSTPAGATGSRCRAGTPPAGTSSPSGSRTSASSCGRCRRSPSTRPGAGLRGSRWTAISSTAAAFTARRRRWSISASSCAGTATGSGSSTTATRVADYARSYEHGIWQPAPRMRPEPPPVAPADPDRRARDRPARAQRLRRALRMSRPRRRRSASGCPTCSPSSRRRASWSASSRPPRRRARRAGPTSSSSRPCSRPRSSPATPPARATASATPRSPPTRRSRTSTSPPSPRAEKPLILHLAQLAWIAEHMNVCFFGPPGHRQDAPRDRAGDQGLPGRAPRRVRDRPAMGRPPRARPAPQRARRRTQTPRALQPARRRRDRLPPARTPGREPALRAGRAPLRTRLDHRHQQPRLRSLGRNPRRRDGRRRPHRPARPPRPHRHPQRQELPAPRTRHRHRPQPPRHARTLSTHHAFSASPATPAQGHRVEHFSDPESGALFAFLLTVASLR